MHNQAEHQPTERSSIRDTFIVLAALVVIIAGARLASSLLLPFLLALFIAVICSAPINALTRRGLPGWIASAVVGIVVLSVMFTVLVMIDSTAQSFIQALPTYEHEFRALMDGWVAWLGEHGIDISREWLAGAINPGSAINFFGGFLSGMGETLSNIVLIIFTVCFLLADAPSFQRKMALSNSERGNTTLSSLRDLAHSMNGYIATKAAISLLTGLLVSLGLWLIDVQFAMLWGFLAFTLNFIPNIGSVLAAIPPVLLSLLDGDHVITGMIIALYACINILIGNMIEPQIMGQRLGLSTLAVFLSLLFWGWMFDHVGMLLSVPLTMVVKFFTLQHPSTAWFALLISNLPDEDEQPASSPDP